MPLTDQQHEAVYRRDVSVVLSSGAGCGKTHVLTQRYLSHLAEDGAEVSQIVAITFTERAARQMRQRIRKAIVETLGGIENDEEAARWEQHLRALETAQISTIHAFCANLLRLNAVEAGLDPRFEVLEEFLSVNLENEALSKCLQDLLTARTTTGEDLRELVLAFGWKPAVAGIQSLLREFDPVPQEQWLDRTAEEVTIDWRAYAGSVLLPEYLQYLSSANIKVARCLWLLNRNECTGEKMSANVDRVLQGMAGLVRSTDLAGDLDAITEAARVQKTEKAKAWETEEIYEDIKKALADFRGELPERLKLFVDLQNETPETNEIAINIGKRFLRVTSEVAEVFRKLKRRQGVLDFQDLLVYARNLLRDRPEVRERLQRRFRFLLIDELQDTDPVQMELVEHLTGAGLTGGKLFAVGDHSQSIYRFRGADVRMFQDLKSRMPYDGRLNLTLNFRSQPAILDFTNALLGPTGRGDIGNALESYEPLKPFHSQVNPGPCVEFLWSPRLDEDNATAARTTEAEWIARRIAGMIMNREKLVADRSEEPAKLRPVKAGDVVLLFRAMSNVQIYEAALRRQGLDYYLVGGRAFFAQQEIYDVLNLLRALENPQDTLSLAGALRSPFCCLSDESLYFLSLAGDRDIWAGLHNKDVLRKLPRGQKSRVERARTHLDRWRGLKNRLPIAGLLNEILADSGFDAALQFEFLGDRKLANLWKMIDMARSFDRSGMFGLAEFIERLNDLVKAQPREEQAATQPENADVVRLMTIHQAKGLEFPVVIVPDLAASFGSGRFPVAHWDRRLGCVVRPPDDPPEFSEFGWKLWSASETVADWREDLRTLYVACTRPMDYLILSASLPDNFNPQSPWMLALAQRFNLRTGAYQLPTESFPHLSVNVTDYHNEPPDISYKEEHKAVVKPIPLPASAAGLTPKKQRGKKVESIADAEWHFEDNADRKEWPIPGSDALERLLRDVLSRWDLSKPDDWQTVLQSVWDSHVTTERKVHTESERLLKRFAESAERETIAGADECLRQIEYMWTAEEEETLFGQSTVIRKGLLDFLCRDKSGPWCGWVFTTQPLGKKKAKADAFHKELRAAADALRQQNVQTFLCYHWRDEKAVTLWKPS